MDRNQRALVYPLVALAIVAGLIALRPKRVEAPPVSTPTTSPPVAPRKTGFEFVRELNVQALPESALRAGVQADRCERWFARMTWGDTQVRDRTAPLLRQLDRQEQLRFTRMASERLERDPNTVAALITGVGQFDLDEARALVLRCAEHPSNFLRAEAARALGAIDGEAAALRAEKLLIDPYEAVRHAAVNSLIEMRSPVALEVLRRFAEREPREGLHATLTHLGMDTSDPSVIPTLRQYIDRNDGLEMVALDALARFGDGNALDRLYSLLSSPAAATRMNALRSLGNAPPEMLEVDRFEKSLSEGNAVLRRLAAELLWHTSQGLASEQRDRLLAAADHVAKDPDPEVAGRAIGTLYTLGRHDVAESYLRAVAGSTGVDLSRAVEFLVRVFRDPRAEPMIRQRLASNPEPRDAAALLAALGLTGDPETWSAFEPFIRHAGDDEPRDPGGIAISFHAALAASRLGPKIVPRLLALLDEDLGDGPHLRALDVLRGIDGADCIAELAAIVRDESRSKAVRLAAIDTLAFLKAPGVFDALNGALPTLQDPELAQRARLVLVEFA